MNKILREGLDVEVAFESQRKRLESLTVPTEVQVHVEPLPVSSALKASPPKVSAMKTLARKAAQLIFRLSKPILRPIAIRARRYLLDGLRIELVQEFQRGSAQMLQEIQKASAPAPAPAPASASAAQEMQKVTASTVLEMQNTLAAVQQTLSNLNNAVFPRLDRIELYSSASARRVAINCDSGEILIRTEVGFVLCASTDHALISALVENGELEPGTRHLIQRFLKPGDSFIDIGANIGMLTLAAARAMEGKGEIIAFEPFAQTRKMLEKSVWMNGFSDITTIHQAAVSNKTGVHHLHLGETSGHHSLFELDTKSDQQKNTVEVSLVTLDDTIDSNKNIDLIKIDAEGAEIDIIECSHKTLMANPNIALIVEFGPSHLRRLGRKTTDWFTVFNQLGFEYRSINSETGALESWTQQALEELESVNIFFARPNSIAWNRVT